MIRKYAVQFNHAPLARRPYPAVCNEDGEVVGNKAFNDFDQIIGFYQFFEAGVLDLHFRNAIESPEKAVGLYPVVAYEDGTWATLECTIEGVTSYED